MLERRGDHVKERGAAKRVAMCVMAVVALVAACAYVWHAFVPMRGLLPPRDPNASIGQLEGKTPDEIQAELDRIVNEGMFNISIAPVVYFADGGSEGDVRIENVPGNRYDMQVSVVLDEDGREVYESGVIEPNHHIQTARLSTSLAAGSYPATASFMALDRQSGVEVGRASAKITLVVES